MEHATHDMTRKAVIYSHLITRAITRRLALSNLVLILSAVVGIAAGFAALLLKSTVHYTTVLLTEGISVQGASILYFAYPFLGILATTLLIKLLVKEDIVHGISRILYSMSRKSSRLRPHNMYTSMIGATLTVGAGGSVGLESPIVLTGSAIGSNLGSWFRLNYKTTTLLVGCGAAGAIAGIFKAPVAGVLFAIEVLMLDLTVASLVPLLISAVAGATVSNLFMGKAVVFSVAVIDPMVVSNLPYYVILGIVAGLVSVYFCKGTMLIEGWMTRLGGLRLARVPGTWRFRPEALPAGKQNIVLRVLVGGFIVGLLILLFPPLYGEGYEALRTVLSGNSAELANGSFFFGMKDNLWFLLGFLCMVLAAKVVAMAVTTGSGGVGGTFAPTLFMGGITGFVVANALNLMSFTGVSDKNFVLAGMAGVMAGVMHAPLTAIFLIAEITGGYSLFVPLILTSAVAYLTSRYFVPHSIYTSRLAQRGELLTHDKDQAVLTLMSIEPLIETDLIKLSPEDTLGTVVKAIASSKRNVFPVVDENGDFVGGIQLDNIRHLIFQQNLYNSRFVYELLTPSPEHIEIGESMEGVMKKFEKAAVWNLPVLRNGKYVGYLSKSKIFSAYRVKLQQFYQD